MATSWPEAHEDESSTEEGACIETRADHRWAALVALCLSVVIVNVDNTILNVALPTLVRTLHATSSQLQWIVDSYAMALAGMLLVGGSLGDRFGRKKLFIFGLTIFLTGSIGAALSGSVPLLIAFRTVMGAGAALTMPSTLSIINDTFRGPRERARAISAWAGSSGLGIAIGPVAGGLLLSRFWWGSVFLVNVPIVVIAVGGAVLLVRDSKNAAADRPDPGGSALSIAGLGLLLWAIIEAPTEGWGSPVVISVGLASVAALAAFVWWEARSDHPMLKLAFFRDRRFAIAAATECLGLFGLFGGLFVQTQFLQFKLGYSPLEAGLRILPVAAAVVVSSPFAVIAVRIAGAKVTAAVGLAAIAGGLWQASVASTPGATYGDVLPGMLIVGIGAGLLLSTATNSLVGSVPQEEAGVGSATNGVSIQVGGALGVAVIGSVLATRYQDRLGTVLATQHVPATIGHQITGSLGSALTVAATLGGATGAQLADLAKAAFMSGTQTSMSVGAGTALAGAALALWLLPSGRTPTESDAEADGHDWSFPRFVFALKLVACKRLNRRPGDKDQRKDDSPPAEPEHPEPVPTESEHPEPVPTEAVPTESVPAETEPSETVPSESAPPETEHTETEPPETEHLETEHLESVPPETESPASDVQPVLQDQDACPKCGYVRPESGK
jgi:EmrB/QacA subfamily drug resistance transporter